MNIIKKTGHTKENDTRYNGTKRKLKLKETVVHYFACIPYKSECIQAHTTDGRNVEKKRIKCISSKRKYEQRSGRDQIADLEDQVQVLFHALKTLGFGAGRGGGVWQTDKGERGKKFAGCQKIF